MARTARFVITVVVVVLVARCGDHQSTNVSGPSAQRCQITLTGLPASIAASGARLDTTVTTTRECQWTAVSEASWVQVAPISGQGQAALTVMVAENAAAIGRSAAIVLNGSRVMVAQDAAPCRFELPRSSAQISADGGSLRVGVSTLAGCAWSVSSDAPWVRATGAQTTGSGSAELLVEENTGRERSGTVSVAGLTFRVEQAAAPPSTPRPPTPPSPPSPTPTPPPTPAPTPLPACSFALDPTTRVIGASGGDARLQVKTNTLCEWTATSGQSWITLANTRGTGDGQVRYTVGANTGAARVGTITIGGQTHRVEQGPVAPPHVILTGRVSNLAGTCAEFRFVVSGRQVITNGNTHFSGGPCRNLENGIDVEVVGDVQGNGVVLATRIDLKPK